MTSTDSRTRERLFGTDGVRGRFGEPPLDRATVTRLAAALARTVGEERGRSGGGEPHIVLGGDTRESTPEICRWITAGLEAGGGARVTYVGVLPTPGIAYLARALGADAGVVVSASHNPWPDNGVKLLSGDGFKWSEEAEAALEARLGETGEVPEPAGAAGLPEVDRAAVDRWLGSLADSVRAAGAGGDRPLAGLSVVLDPGNGAASHYAGDLFTSLGAETRVIHADPDGRNVNAGCGSTNPGAVAEAVREAGADLGVAFDGDADRANLVDETGTVRDGDAILYLWASSLAAAGELTGGAIVATSMSNLGLERALAARGVDLVRCGVGDRVVVDTLRERGLELGGEQSGHVVHLGLSTTGDGLLTALQMALRAARDDGSLSEQLAGFERYPQVLVNVRVREKRDFDRMPSVRTAERRVEEELGAEGRLVLRYSGTEPLARVMIEGKDQAAIEALAEEIAAAIREEVGAGE